MRITHEISEAGQSREARFEKSIPLCRGKSWFIKMPHAFKSGIFRIEQQLLNLQRLNFKVFFRNISAHKRVDSAPF
jgi:hypothetical protein